MNRKIVVTLAIVLIIIFSFIYVTAFGISRLSNEKILFLFLDETKGDPGTVEVASLALFEDARLKEDLIKINPLHSTESLKREGIFLSDSLIKASSLEEGIQNAQIIAEYQTSTTIDRTVLVNSSVLRHLISAVHPIPIDKSFTVTVLDTSFHLRARTQVTGEAAEQCIRGNIYPGIKNEELTNIPEDYLWEVKSEIIGAVAKNLLDLTRYNSEQRENLAFTLVEQYKKDRIFIRKKNTVLIMVYYLPEFISKRIVSFAVRRIV
ncbi:MAG: hypothetical protein HXS46_08450 [Theionarchaea archaeon]|nr:MAG: hypothetical protein AYK18_05910 [Theionarchaea archaeon DG-70]MBU7010707.1 hypothetical protein [Theionarchaea archaeon]